MSRSLAPLRGEGCGEGRGKEYGPALVCTAAREGLPRPNPTRRYPALNDSAIQHQGQSVNLLPMWGRSNCTTKAHHLDPNPNYNAYIDTYRRRENVSRQPLCNAETL